MYSGFTAASDNKWNIEMIAIIRKLIWLNKLGKNKYVPSDNVLLIQIEHNIHRWISIGCDDYTAYTVFHQVNSDIVLSSIRLNEFTNEFVVLLLQSMEEILDCYRKQENPEINRQMEFIIKQLNSEGRSPITWKHQGFQRRSRSTQRTLLSYVNQSINQFII